MKKDTKLVDFYKQIAYIGQHMEPRNWRDCIKPITTPTVLINKTEWIPVVATFQDMELIFPDRGIAFKMLTTNMRKCVVSTATSAEFRAQHMSYDKVVDFIMAVTSA
jgi:hypothetical protein